jgi:tetratricopeptide (TPR) repeat protein
MIRGMDARTAESLLAEATEVRKSLRGPGGEAAKARLNELYPDLESAFELFLAEGRTDDALELATALVSLWMATKRIGEGDGWFRRALHASGGSERTRARALYEHGYLIFWAGDYARSAALSSEAIALARPANDVTVIALALAVLGRIALNTDVEEAKRLLREAIAVTEGTADREGRSSAMHVLGVAHQMSGDFEAASEVMRARISLGRETGNETLIAVESANLSMVERQLGNLERAQALSTEALEIVSRLGEELMIPWVVNGLAAVTAALGDLERAAILNGFAEAGIERAGGQWPPDEREQYEWTLATLRAGMAPDALDLAREQGGRLSSAAGVELARSARPAGAPAA